MFKSKNVVGLPTKKELKGTELKLVFKDSEAAKIAYNFIRKESELLKVYLSENSVIASLVSAEENRIRSEAVDQVVYVINNRLNTLGVESILVQKHGSRQVVVQIPGVDDPQRVRDLITRTAHLEFKIILQSAATKEELLDAFDGDLPPDKKIVPEGRAPKEDEEEEDGVTWHLVSAFPDLTGEHIVDARVKPGEYGSPMVSFKLDRSGAKTFKELTGSNIHKRLAIVIDDVVHTAPRIDAAIGAEGVITGRYTYESANDLAIVLRTGSFQAPVVYQEERRIGPSLGQDSINRGLFSCLIGLALVFSFSLFYYKIGGLFAMLALVLNLFFILLFLSYFQATLTLPGIAGMVLTIGMAIDASILIYEKIKEELAEGTSYKKAVHEGFRGAMVVIFDSNITTFLTGMVLMYYGSPSIRGFAMTLMVGIVATILAGVFFLRTLFDFVLDITPFKKIWL